MRLPPFPPCPTNHVVYPKGRSTRTSIFRTKDSAASSKLYTHNTISWHHICECFLALRCKQWRVLQKRSLCMQLSFGCVITSPLSVVLSVPFLIPKLTRCCDCCWNINARIFSHFLRYGTFAHTTVAIPVQPLFLLLSFPCHTLVLLVPTVRYWIRLGEGRVSSNENINAVRSWCSKLSYP